MVIKVWEGITDSMNEVIRRPMDGLYMVKRPLLCLPIMAKSREGLCEQAAEAAAHRPDLIEWRADGLDWSRPEAELHDLLVEVKKSAGGVPLVFTLRKKGEGGLCSLPEEMRIKLMEQAINTGHLAYLDAELSTDASMIKRIINAAGGNGTRVILSYHDFDGTPGEDFLIGIIKSASEMGADIAKVAVTAKSGGDVLRLLGAAYKVKNDGTGIPFSVMAMGPLGAFTRIAAGVFGSEIVYASGGTVTAPGQIPVEDFRKLWSVLFENCGRRDLDDYCHEHPCNEGKP